MLVPGVRSGEDVGAKDRLNVRTLKGLNVQTSRDEEEVVPTRHYNNRGWRREVAATSKGTGLKTRHYKKEGPTRADCYETAGKIEVKETFRVPERLFSLW